jgi:hypothetical protein
MIRTDTAAVKIGIAIATDIIAPTDQIQTQYPASKPVFMTLVNRSLYQRGYCWLGSLGVASGISGGGDVDHHHQPAASLRLDVVVRRVVTDVAMNQHFPGCRASQITS